jgi:MFS family permease
MYKRTKLGCYTVNIAMAAIVNFPPLLFITFREAYGISYSLLGLLVLINFCTQLSVDLILSFFSHKFNIPLTVKSIPVFASVGFAMYALAPFIFPNAPYIGLVIGTVIFSASGGLAEVLISPVVAAIPSENPEREMSKLHSSYAWGAVGVILFASAFLLVFDESYWWILALIFAIIPLGALALFLGAEIPMLESSENDRSSIGLLKNRMLWICVLGIFLGGAAECTMSQWCSGYLESALGIPKALGDIFGVALFSIMLGLGRTLYAKRGKNVEKTLLTCAIASSVCYLIATFSPFAALGLVAAALTGLATSMLWPGTLIVAEKKFPTGGVFIFAMMASGGDLGASVVPQLVGIVTDTVSSSSLAAKIGASLSLTAEQVGMRAGLMVASLFPIIAIFVFAYILKSTRKEEKIDENQDS